MNEKEKTITNLRERSTREKVNRKNFRFWAQ